MSPVARLFEARVRGFRVIEIAALACLILLIFWVYLTKAQAGDERARIAQMDSDIAAEQQRVRMLKAESAHLEQPSRIEHLSEAYLDLKPVPAKREATPQTLPELVRSPPPPAPPAAASPPAEAPAQAGAPAAEQAQ